MYMAAVGVNRLNAKYITSVNNGDDTKGHLRVINRLHENNLHPSTNHVRTEHRTSYIDSMIVW